MDGAPFGGQPVSGIKRLAFGLLQRDRSTYDSGLFEKLLKLDLTEIGHSNSLCLPSSKKLLHRLPCVYEMHGLVWDNLSISIKWKQVWPTLERTWAMHQV